IKTNEVSSVSKTSSAQPLGSKGKEITAQDNSGQAITTLNDDIEIELNYYKEDITEANVKDMGKLELLTNSYWDSSVGDWVPMSTTKKAYTKANASDAEWTAQSDFGVFIDALEANPNTYGDYKITLQSTSSHLTIFGATIPSDLTAPTAPTGLSQTSGNGTSVVLDWSNNSEADLLEYEVYRSTSSGVAKTDANQRNTSQVVASAFTDSTTAWTSYYYTVTAVDDSGNESAVATEIRVCSNSTVANGTVANTCAITCNSGYTVSGNSCAAQGGGGSYTPATLVTNASITIAGGAASVANTAVALTLAATNATQMAISNAADFAGAVWETFAVSKAWTLTLGEGIKTVYAKFRDAAGVASSAVFDTITLGNILTPSPTPNPISALTSYTDGTLLKSSGEPEVYVIKNGNKVWIASPDEFEKAGYKWSDIKIVSGEVLKSIGSVMLIRVEGDHKVYAIRNNVKRHIKSPDEFNAAGYKWDSIVVVKKSEADAYADEGASGTVEVTFAWLRVRASNTVKSAQLSMVYKGDTFDILDSNNGWYKIKTAKGVVGWISGQYAAVKNNSGLESAAGGNLIVINTSRLRVREANNTVSAVLGEVEAGQEFNMLEEKNGWYKIKASDNITGWVSGIYAVKK
ncbi:SH3 domain-containing protein, partial [Patescibacteria group bacterium]|nr:SH3 domain-containing protein [Patescibacteria group bacterium]